MHKQTHAHMDTEWRKNLNYIQSSVATEALLPLIWWNCKWRLKVKTNLATLYALPYCFHLLSDIYSTATLESQLIFLIPIMQGLHCPHTKKKNNKKTHTQRLKCTNRYICAHGHRVKENFELHTIFSWYRSSASSTLMKLQYSAIWQFYFSISSPLDISKIIIKFLIEKKIIKVYALFLKSDKFFFTHLDGKISIII